METRFIDVDNESSSLGFSIQDDNGKPWWNCVDHNQKPLCIVSNRCGTCPAVFKLVKEIGEPFVSEHINSQLNVGIVSLSDAKVDVITSILPKGKYLVSLQKITPKYSRVNNGEIGYSWVNKLDFPFEDGFLSDFVYPIVPERVLSQERIQHYYHLPYTSKDSHPTALAVSFMVDRAPGGRGLYTYIGHILLDGHHKMMAASWRGSTISLLSFWVANSFVSDLTDKMADRFVRSIYPD